MEKVQLDAIRDACESIERATGYGEVTIKIQKGKSWLMHATSTSLIVPAPVPESAGIDKVC